MAEQPTDSRRIGVSFNLLLTAVICGALAIVPLLSLAPGSSWPAQLENMPRTLADVWHVSKRAAAASYILPLVGALIAITGFCISIVPKNAPVLSKVVQVECLSMAALAVIISVLLKGVPFFALVFLPLGFALYSVRKG
jgi:hypothetical protein